MKNGVPFHTAFGTEPEYQMNDAERFALWIVFASYEGHEWDWRTGAFKMKSR